MIRHSSSTGPAHESGPVEAAAPSVQLIGVGKQYPNGVRACVDIDLELVPGTVHAIVGENGAGKSTLMKILYGLERPSVGRILLDGADVRLAAPDDAIRHGIGMVHQSFMIVPEFTVAQNVVLGGEPARAGVVDRAAVAREVTDVSARFGLPVNPKAKARDVSVSVLQRVEILRALYRGARVLILDEPTAVLTPQETAELFQALRAFAAAGRSVVFISHKLHEVLEVADEITVVRAGRIVGRTTPAQTSPVELASLMIGRPMTTARRVPTQARGDQVMHATGLECRNDLGQLACTEIDLTLRAGEIVCAVAVEGNGQTELVECIAGLRPATAGSLTIDGRDVTTSSVAARRARGLRHIPEDRMRNGVALPETIGDNLIVDRASSREFRWGPFQSIRAIRAWAETAISRFAIRAADPDVPVGSLSGGNIQKVIVARELRDGARVILAAQPTRGIDVGSMEFVHDEIRRARDGGAAVFVVTADLGEAKALADRLLVMREGRIVAEWDDPAAVTDEEMGIHMLGADREPRR
ncbi:ABC transporter ATP-binding protein [Microbacterium lushaniae]|uniref:ABC transporter ATP-binding protein n=1 Tax=Microbacterium lushaniae TaxID=2614639 RepID=A0A5J6L1K8_9MICO|nr:ABC transporter ATP-binding protein [Microbacterium lushaniae]QEW02272.1 ABC transporter ATP-binding protein [Microbacterium lushaniae]